MVTVHILATTIQHARTVKENILLYDRVIDRPRSSKDKRGVKVLAFAAFQQ